ncbi:hypothetical protein XaC1_48 [Xanthomonas phage XaC1]|nr:hypothetical protein XaC1_48 [Xanthomonas phage XaC1]
MNYQIKRDKQMTELPLHYHIADSVDMNKWPEHYNYCALQANGTLSLFVSQPVFKEYQKSEKIYGHTGYYLRTEYWSEFRWEGSLSIFYPIKIARNRYYGEMFFSREQIQQIKDNYANDIQVQKEIVLEQQRKEKEKILKEEKKESFHAMLLGITIVLGIIIITIAKALEP